MGGRKPVSLDEWLYRRSYSSPEKKYMNPDGSATSRVFKLREKDQGDLSVDVKSMTTAELSVGDPMRFFLFEVSNKLVNDLELESFHDPLEGGSNDAHAVITGMTMEDDILPGLLARASKKVLLG